VIYALEGILIEKHTLFAAVDVKGIVFRVFIPLSTYDKLPDVNNKCRLFVEAVIGEKMIRLYGFSSLEEKELFNSLRKVSKIGAQTALSILSTLSIEQFYNAVADKNEKILTTVPGVGKKTALSIIVEFSSKLPEMQKVDTIVSDAVSTLESLGFSSSESFKRVKAIYDKSSNITIEELIREALKQSKKNVY